MKRPGFTLIELLVVIAIISLLVSILMPSLDKAKQLAQKVTCMSQERGVGLAILFYTNDNNGSFPTSGDVAGGNSNPWHKADNWINLVGVTYLETPGIVDGAWEGGNNPVGYFQLGRQSIWLCPRDERPTRNNKYNGPSYGINMILTGKYGGVSPCSTADLNQPSQIPLLSDTLGHQWGCFPEHIINLAVSGFPARWPHYHLDGDTFAFSDGSVNWVPRLEEEGDSAPVVRDIYTNASDYFAQGSIFWN